MASRALNSLAFVALLSAAAVSAVFGADMTPEQTIKARQSNLKDLGGALPEQH